MSNGLLEAAVAMAAAYMKDGMPPVNALRIAAGEYGFSVSEVAQAAGHRGGKAVCRAKRQTRAQREAAEAFDFIKPKS